MLLLSCFGDRTMSPSNQMRYYQLKGDVLLVEHFLRVHRHVKGSHGELRGFCGELRGFCGELRKRKREGEKENNE